MSDSEVTYVLEGDSNVFDISGYFAKEGGAMLRRQVMEILERRPGSFVFDFRGCSLISSPGAAALLDLSLIIVDDYQQRLVISGLDRSKTEFLDITGVIPVAEVAKTREEALQILQED